MYAVEMKGITKQYPLVRALDQVDFSLKKGEILSLLGENGAGKSTLMKVLYGICKADEGEIKVNGNAVKIRKPQHAIDLGIGMVHQHFMLTPVFTVTENIVVGQEPVKGILFDKTKAEEEVQAMIDRYGFQISAIDKVADLSVGQQQKVEILKAIYRKAKILILDEPTAALDPIAENDIYMKYNDMTSGKTSVFISHRLASTRFCDRIIFVADGNIAEEGTHESLLALGGEYAKLFEVQSRYYQEGREF